MAVAKSVGDGLEPAMTTIQVNSTAAEKPRQGGRRSLSSGGAAPQIRKYVMLLLLLQINRVVGTLIPPCGNIILYLKCKCFKNCKRIFILRVPTVPNN